MQPAEILRKFKRLLPWRSLTVVLVVAFMISQPVFWPGGFGFSKGESVATKTVETVGKNAQGQITKTVETTKFDDGKTLWDWLSLLGVPLSLAILGYWLQQAQQKRAEKLAEEQRELAADETKEEVLQVYFDRLSVLLVDKNLLAIAAKGERGTTLEEKELLDSAVDVIRARTLSILRRFEKDPERKTSVIRFLIEADIVSKLKLNLSGADLSGVNLSGANLSDADVCDADLSGADLCGANLTNAKLSNVNLSGADLRHTNLSHANLYHANLSEANLQDAELKGALLIEANLQNANLQSANLQSANLIESNIRGAILFGTNLSSAVGFTEEELKDTKLCRTILPDGEISNRDCKLKNYSSQDFQPLPSLDSWTRGRSLKDSE